MKDVYIDKLNEELDQERQTEEADHQFNLMQDRFTRIFVVPTGKQDAEKTVSKLISEYKDDVGWDDVMGNVSIAGRENITYTKEGIFPEEENQEPSKE